MGKLLMLFCFIGLIGCGGMKDVTKFKADDKVLGLYKGACSGKCSVYNLDIYKNRYVVYEGIMNVENYGLYAKKITAEEYNALIAEFDKEDFYSFENQYPIPSTELPTITMLYNKAKLSKSIKGSIDRPQKLLALQRVLEKLAKSDGFKLVKAYEPKISASEQSDDKQANNSEIIDDQFIVELNSNVFMSEWLRKYKQYDARLVKKVAPDLNYWVISFSKQKTTSSELFAIFKQDKELKMVEQNKRVSPRQH